LGPIEHGGQKRPQAKCKERMMNCDRHHVEDGGGDG
jgi:hypothetical protein